MVLSGRKTPLIASVNVTILGNCTFKVISKA